MTDIKDDADPKPTAAVVEAVRRTLMTALSPEARAGLRLVQKELAELWGVIEDECSSLIGGIAEVRDRLGEDGDDWCNDKIIAPESIDPVEVSRAAAKCPDPAGGVFPLPASQPSGVPGVLRVKTLAEIAAMEAEGPPPPKRPSAVPGAPMGSLSARVLECIKRHGGSTTAGIVAIEVYGDAGRSDNASCTLSRMKLKGLVQSLGDRQWAAGKSGSSSLRSRKVAEVLPPSKKLKVAAESKRVAASKTGQRAKWGRGAMATVDEVKKAHELKAKGGTVRNIATNLGLSKSSVGKIVKDDPDPARDSKWQRALDLIATGQQNLAQLAKHVYGENTTKNRQRTRSMLRSLRNDGKPIHELDNGGWAPSRALVPGTDGSPTKLSNTAPHERLQRPKPASASAQAGRQEPALQPMFRCRAEGCGALKFEGQIVAHLVEEHGRLDLTQATAASDEVRAAYEGA